MKREEVHMLRVYVIGDLRGAYRNKYLVDILERDPDIALSGSYVKGKLKKALSVFACSAATSW